MIIEFIYTVWQQPDDKGKINGPHNIVHQNQQKRPESVEWTLLSGIDCWNTYILIKNLWYDCSHTHALLARRKGLVGDPYTNSVHSA